MLDIFWKTPETMPERLVSISMVGEKLVVRVQSGICFRSAVYDVRERAPGHIRTRSVLFQDSVVLAQVVERQWIKKLKDKQKSLRCGYPDIIRT